MPGTSGTTADAHDDPLDTGDPATPNRFTDVGTDAQNQYQRVPNAVVVQLAWLRGHHRCPAFLAGQPVADIDGNALPEANTSDTTRILSAMATCVFENRCGASAAWCRQTGTTSSLPHEPSRVHGNVSADPGIGGETLDVRSGRRCSGPVHRVPALQRRHARLRRPGPQLARQRFAVAYARFAC